MAHFYPAVDNDFHSSQGEKLVYQALQKLNNEYSIFHSYHWLGEPAQQRSEGEADFIIVHPQKGILSVEVKSGGISFRDGNWIQTNRNTGAEKVIDPLGQAAESQYRIINLLKNQFSHVRPLIGRAAWFTSVVLPEKLSLPLEATRAIVLDQASLDNPEQALDGAFTYWQRNLGFQPTGLTTGQYKDLLHVLMPSFQLAETVSNIAGENENAYVQLTKQQASVLDFLQEQRNAMLYGPAGTGKTLLAMEKAKMLAAAGKKVLYLCFNEFLLQHLRKQEHSPLLTFHNVRTLAQEILEDDSIPINEINQYFEDYFATDFDDNDWQYPNIVVDEGQDITDEMLEHLSFLAEWANGAFYVFYDRNQYLMGEELPELLDSKAECRLVLYRNCRNTAEIATSIGNFAGMRVESYLNKVHGEKPKAVFYLDKKELSGIAAQFVKDMLQQRVKLEDMVILSVHSVEHSALYGLDELAGIPVSLEPEQGKIWFTSVRKYKGLEAKAVLLTDIEVSRLEEPVMRRLIYVGGSRATTYLKLAFYENVPKKFYGQLVKNLAEEKQERQKMWPMNMRTEQENMSNETKDINSKIVGNRKSLVGLLGMEP
ncbi:MAG: NERD domain-containing protein [Acidaminococcaceae bacterium]|nr:NERD domain-containing protein [Acidaminococcaceae bacterium]